MAEAAEDRFDDEEVSVNDGDSFDGEGADILDMSDEELDAYYAKQQSQPQPEAQANEEEVQDTQKVEDTQEEVLADDSGDDTEGDDDPVIEQAEAVDGDKAEPAAAASENTADEAGEPEQKASDESTSEIDYKAEYEKIIAPFKANGKMIQVDNVDDMITLARMGANYNKKMAALKPSLKIVKMLEQNELLDEAKLSHLIDISKKDPVAIGKLLQDANINPMDLDSDTDEVKDYRPNDYRVNDQEVELDTVLAQIRDNESYPTTIDTIGNKWDAQSREMILNDPQIIPVIDEHVQSGIFEKIVTVMERERMLGRLDGVPDLYAYKQIGDKLDAEGAFQSLGQQPAPTQQNQAPQQNVQSPQPETNLQAEAQAAEEARRQKRKAAGSNRSAPAKAPVEFDPLSMSDEEFNKLSMEDYYR